MASSSSDFENVLAYALHCVQQESLTLNEHQGLIVYISVTFLKYTFTVRLLSLWTRPHTMSQAYFFTSVISEKNRLGDEAIPLKPLVVITLHLCPPNAAYTAGKHTHRKTNRPCL